MSLRRTVAPLMAALVFSGSAIAQRPQTAGLFTDRAKKQHLWSIDASHTLIWDGAQYLPVGGNFSPHYLAEGATEENWTKDTEALGKVKEKGVLDLIVNPVVSAVDVPAAAWQRFIDYLDANGFRYGIAFGAGITTPLRGWVVKPTNYRIEDIRENVDVSWNVADADSGYFIFVDGVDASQIPHEGPVRVREGIASVPGHAGTANGAVAIFYPHKSIKATREWALPDVWSSFDRYRDRLLTTFAQVKFGPGLRFFLDPLVHPLGLKGESDYLVPDSPSFRLEWGAYLTQHYPALDDLMNAWGVLERNIQDFKQAARLIPLFADSRGVPFMLDTGTNKRLECKGTDRFWSDLRDCRNESLIYYMNTAADLLKRELADVPVVYTRSQHHRIFSNTLKQGGYDGLGIAAYGAGSAVAMSGADSAYSQISEAGHPLWCVVTETLDNASPTKPALGYASQQMMYYGLDWLKSIGAKGFYVNGLQVLPEAAYQNQQLVKAPEQLDWLREYGIRLARNVGGVRPYILPFPEAAAGYVPSGPIGRGGVWWVPSLATGRALGFGSSYAGYIINLPPAEGGDMTVIWSLKGARTTHLLVADPRNLQIPGNCTTAEGQQIPVKVDLKAKTAIITLDENPIILKGADPEILPLEAVQDVFAELKALVAQAESQKLGGSHYQFAADRAQSNYRRGDYRVAFYQAVEVLNGIVNALQPYTWLEGERAESHTFSEVTSAPAASGGAFLALSSEARPGPSGYGATYKFNVPANDSYSVYLAGTPLGANASPFVWIVDVGAPHLGSEAAQVGGLYMNNQFGWLNLGRISLDKGPHTLTLRITDVSSANKYTFAVDALLITRGLFTPNGTTRPSLVSPEDLNRKYEKPKPDKSRGKGKGSK